KVTMISSRRQRNGWISSTIKDRTFKSAMITQESIGYKYLLTGFFSVLLAVCYAQEEEKQAPVTIDSIDVVSDYRPMLVDAVKIRRSPDMEIDREALETELRWILANAYFVIGEFRKPYYGKLLDRHRDASPT